MYKRLAPFSQMAFETEERSSDRRAFPSRPELGRVMFRPCDDRPMECTPLRLASVKAIWNFLDNVARARK
jgi:hypothetical protein